MVGIPSAVLEEKETLSASNVGMLDSGKSYRRQFEITIIMNNKGLMTL